MCGPRPGTVVELRRLTPADEGELRALLREDVWNHVYLLGMLHWHGTDGPRVRFTGAFASGRLVGVLGEAREVHCWYASLSAGDPAVASALGGELIEPRVEVVLGRADVVSAALAALPTARVLRTSQLMLGISHDAMPRGSPRHPVRRATLADVPGLVDLYEGTSSTATRRVATCGARSKSTSGAAPYGCSSSTGTRSPRDASTPGLRHCGAAHVGNTRVAHLEHRDHAPWLVANLALPPAPLWRELVRRVRGRLSPWDRPCRRRRPAFTLR